MKLQAENIVNFTSAAFRLLGEIPELSEKTENRQFRFQFQIHDPAIKGYVILKMGKAFWSESSYTKSDVRIVWENWDTLVNWVNGRLPLWWPKLLGRVKIEGKIDPVVLESIYFFRYNLRLLLHKSRESS